MDFVAVLTNFLAQMVFFCVNIFIISLIAGKLQRISLTACPKLYIAFSALGTPIHETGHALMALLFGQKVTEFKPFNLEVMDDGICFGYIRREYRNSGMAFLIYQIFGNYFIGIAPVFFCAIMIIVALFLFLPSTFTQLLSYMDGISAIPELSVGPEMFTRAKDIFVDIVRDIWAGTIADWGGLLFAVCAIAFALNMSMSVDSDLRHALCATPLFALILFAFNTIFAFIDFGTYTTVAAAMSTGGVILAFMLVLALAISLAMSIIISLLGAIIRAIQA